MRPISLRVRQVLDTHPRMKRCALAGLSRLHGPCSAPGTRPEWHHVWIYAGRQIDEPWAIVAACPRHHDEVKSQPSIKAAFEEYSLRVLATDEDLAEYPKKDWGQIKRALGITRRN